VSEGPFAEHGVEGSVANGPGNVGIIGVDPAKDERDGRQNLCEGRMLLIQAQVEFLQVADTRSDVRHLIDSDGFAERGATGENCH